jgi:OOP family OmpA-OmpF porin
LITLGILLPALSPTTVPAAEVVVEDEVVVEEVTEEHVIKTVENFVVLFDASGSMAEPYKDQGVTKGELAKRLLKERNTLLPDLDWNAGLYQYTPWRTKYRLQTYDKVAFAEGIDSLPQALASQSTPLGGGIQRLHRILPGVAGRTAVIVFSDGEYTKSKYNPVDPVEEAQGVANKFDVCFLLISTATSEAGKKTLNEIAQVNQCSRVIPAEWFYTRPGFVTNALWTVRSDVKVISKTYEKVTGIRIEDVLFDTDKTDIRPKFVSELETLGAFLNEYSAAYLVLSGYTDGTYTSEYNLELSRKRTESVAEYLKAKFNIGADRMVRQWYGKRNPVAGNDTEEGRRLNRRVEIRVEGVD